MFRSFITRTAATVIAAASLQAAAMTVAAEEISIPGDEVAEALERLFSATQVRLHSAGGTATSATGRRSFYDPNGSYIRFGGQLGNRRHPILTEESGLSVQLESSDNGGGYHDYFVNLNDVNSIRVDVTALDDGFRMTFTLEPDDPEVAIGCVHLRGGSVRSCPATATAGRGPQVNWNQPADWTAARMRIKLEPVLQSGSVALRATDVELTGDADPPDAMGCS